MASTFANEPLHMLIDIPIEYHLFYANYIYTHTHTTQHIQSSLSAKQVKSIQINECYENDYCCKQASKLTHNSSLEFRNDR